MAKHTSFFTDVSHFFKGYKKETYYAETKNVTIFTKAGLTIDKDIYVDDVHRAFSENVILGTFFATKESLVYVTHWNENYNLLHIVRFNEDKDKDVFIKVKDKTLYPLFGGLDYFIFRDYASNKYKVIDALGNVCYENIEKYQFADLTDGYALVFKIDNRHYVCTRDFDEVEKFDYLTKFGKDSPCLIGIDYDVDANKKIYYYISSVSDIAKSDFTYKRIEPCEKADSDSGSDRVMFYIVTNWNGYKRIIDINGNDIFNQDFELVGEFAHDAALCSIRDRGMAIARTDGKLIFVDVQKTLFNFREVKYGFFNEIYAGVQNFDGFSYVDVDGNFHMVYNTKRFDKYIEEEKRK